MSKNLTIILLSELYYFPAFYQFVEKFHNTLSINENIREINENFLTFYLFSLEHLLLAYIPQRAGVYMPVTLGYICQYHWGIYASNKFT